MSEQEVIDQLSRYGTWLEGEVGIRLKGDDWSRFDALVAFDGSDEVDPDLIQPIEPIEILAPARSEGADSPVASAEQVRSLGARIPRSARVSVGATVLLLVTVLGGPWLRGQSLTLTTVDLPPDPPGALFVLPDPAQELELGGEWVDGPLEYGDPPLPLRGYVFALAEGSVYHHPVSAWVYEGEPDPVGNGPAFEAPAPGGTAIVEDLGRSRHVYQQRDQFFVSLNSSSMSNDELLELLGELEMDSDGRLILYEGSDLTLMDTFDRDPIEAWVGGSSLAINGESAGRIMIETGGVSSGSTLAGFTGGQWSRWERAGRSGWEVRGAFEYVQASSEHDGQEESSSAVMWEATPNWVVFVSGQVPIEELHQIVAGLRIVSEEEWREAFED